MVGENTEFENTVQERQPEELTADKESGLEEKSFEKEKPIKLGQSKELKGKVKKDESVVESKLVRQK